MFYSKLKTFLGTLDLSGDFFGVSSNVYGVFSYLEDHLNKSLNDEKLQSLKDTIRLMTIKFNEYWSKIKSYALICQVLDPRFKHFLLSDDLKQEVSCYIFLPK